MTAADDRCPPARQCIDEMLDEVARRTSPLTAAADRDITEWLRRVRGDRKALQVLEEARRVGADLPRLLLVAATLVGARAWLEGPLAAVRTGPMRLALDRVRDVNEVLGHAEAVEEALDCESPQADELRVIKRTLDALEEDVREHEGEVRTSRVPDGHGGFADKRWVANGAFVGVSTVTATIGPGHAGLRAATGAPGDPALDVVLILVMGHLRAVAGETRVAFAPELLLHGLKAGDTGGAADPLAALRTRASRACLPSRAKHRQRARHIAGILQIVVQVD